jgi:hypothetical protein
MPQHPLVITAERAAKYYGIIVMPGPPVSTISPSIIAPAGIAVGNSLSSNTGSWNGSPTFTRQWVRGNNNIAGATGAAYVLVIADVGAMISCDVTATNVSGSTTERSNALGPITALGQ